MLGMFLTLCGYSYASDLNTDDILGAINRANMSWQNNNVPEVRSFWDNAAYHTGNMEVYALIGDEDYLDYSIRWAEHNEWKGAKSDDKSKWKYSYGESDEYVLFGDYQICFQTYADLYGITSDVKQIARAREVMEYQMSTRNIDYWWWVDALYMVMPVMTKMYKITGNELYLEKLHEYFTYTNDLMYDEESNLYFRDANYIYPKHKTSNGKKDFWSRGNGWAFAALVKVLKDLPMDNIYREEYITRYKVLAKSLLACQQSEGYWTRSLIDPDYAPGKETSGTAFFTYGFFWGINNGYLDSETYLEAALQGWNYLSNVALQGDGKVGYVQPIGDKAIPGQIINKNSTANFGVGAFLLAACEVARYAEAATNIDIPTSEVNVPKIYPNPANDYICILYSEEVMSVEIISLNSEVVYHSSEEYTGLINVGAIPPGCYIVKIRTNQQRTEHLKLVINR